MGNVVLFGLMVAAFYLLVLAPARNRARRSADIKEHLKPGAEVLTTSGIFGRVDRLTEDSMFVEIAPGVVVRFGLAALRKIVLPKVEPPGPVLPDQTPAKPQDDDPPMPKTS